ncbi:MAG: hypothetical protein JG776_2163 [Caloramator sp.]|jgi:hypothetical protein|nr:hypothetical protein [Caloramator sp.]
MKGLEEDLKRKINAVNQYITSNNIQRVKIWIHNYYTKLDPHRPLAFLHFSVDYVKEKISKYLAA